nr:hypothetical protein [uncultured Bacteroides sp.]
MKIESIEIEKMVSADYWRLVELITEAKSISHVLVNSEDIDNAVKMRMLEIDDCLCDLLLHASTAIGLDMHIRLTDYADSKQPCKAINNE